MLVVVPKQRGSNVIRWPVPYSESGSYGCKLFTPTLRLGVNSRIANYGDYYLVLHVFFFCGVCVFLEVKDRSFHRKPPSPKLETLTLHPKPLNPRVVKKRVLRKKAWLTSLQETRKADPTSSLLFGKPRPQQSFEPPAPLMMALPVHPGLQRGA